MRAIIIAATACLALAGCQTTASIDEAIQDSLPQVCSAAETAHLAFTAAALAGVVPERTIAREAAAWRVLQPLCIDPAGATSGTVLVAAASAYAAIAVALREAETR